LIGLLMICLWGRIARRLVLSALGTKPGLAGIWRASLASVLLAGESGQRLIREATAQRRLAILFPDLNPLTSTGCKDRPVNSGS
jgi:hypothetical protein